MSAVTMTARPSELSPRFNARVAEVFHLLTTLTAVSSVVDGRLGVCGL